MYAIYGNMEPINIPQMLASYIPYTIHLGDFVRANVGIHIPAPAGSVMGIFICEAQLLAAQSSKWSIHIVSWRIFPKYSWSCWWMLVASAFLAEYIVESSPTNKHSGRVLTISWITWITIHCLFPLINTPFLLFLFPHCCRFFYLQISPSDRLIFSPKATATSDPTPVLGIKCSQTLAHRIHGAGIFTNICPRNHPNVWYIC